MSESILLTELRNNKVLNLAKTLHPKGTLHQQGDYCYLKIDDHYIHEIYPLLSSYGNVKKPDYFNSPHGVGAHISVIYPEENVALFTDNTVHGFSVIQLVKANYQRNTYYVLIVDAPSLEDVRKQYKLDPRPWFQNQRIVFHITVGVDAVTADNSCCSDTA